MFSSCANKVRGHTIATKLNVIARVANTTQNILRAMTVENRRQNERSAPPDKAMSKSAPGQPPFNVVGGNLPTGFEHHLVSHAGKDYWLRVVGGGRSDGLPVNVNFVERQGCRRIDLNRERSWPPRGGVDAIKTAAAASRVSKYHESHH
jgi:hypothetical protein